MCNSKQSKNTPGLTENVDHENGEWYPYDEPLVLYVQKTWQITAGGAKDIASWADADSRDPAAVVVRLLTGKLDSWVLNDECDAFGPGILAWQASALKTFGPGPGHENIFHTWSTDLQLLAELTSIYGDRYRHAEFVQEGNYPTHLQEKEESKSVYKKNQVHCSGLVWCLVSSSF